MRPRRRCRPRCWRNRNSRGGCGRCRSCCCSGSRCRCGCRGAWAGRRRWRRTARCQDVALTAGSRLTSTVAEVLVKGGVVLLHSGCSAGVATSHCAVNHVKACLTLVQPQLEPGIAATREVLRPPLDVKDAVGRSATYRCEYAKPGVDQIQVVPIRVDRVVMSGPRQALVGEGGIGGCKLRVTVGRQIDARKCLIVDRVREGQRDGSNRIIPVIADVRRAWHNRAAYLSYRVMV